jgi:threonine synthase
MQYISTRGAAPALDFEATMLTGLARDGGLYVPAEMPVLAPAEIAALAGPVLRGGGLRVMRPFIGDAFTDDEFARHDRAGPMPGSAIPRARR